MSGAGDWTKARRTAVIAGDIATGAVSYAKIQDVSATDKVLGRSTAGAGDVEEIACTAFGRSLIDDADAAAGRTTLGLAEQAHADQAAVTMAPDDGTIAGLTVSDPPTQAEVQALRAQCEILRDTVASLTVLCNRLRTDLIALDLIKGSA